MIFGELLRAEKPSLKEKLVWLSTSGRITRHIPADQTSHFSDETATLVQHTVWNTQESKAEKPLAPDPASGLVIAAWARIDNRADLSSALGIADAPHVTDKAYILRSYEKWGEDCVNHLLGDFAFAIYDPREKKLFCARDHFGARPFYYELTGDRFIFATGLKVFVELKGGELKPSREWMAKFLIGDDIGFDLAAYEGIKKLPPAHRLTVTKEKTTLDRYFRFSPDKTLRLGGTGEYVEAYRELFNEAVRCRLRSAYPIGAELSGGLDSSSVTCCAATLMEHPERDLYAFGFPMTDLDPSLINAVTDSVKMAGAHIIDNSFMTDEQLWLGLATDMFDLLGRPEQVYSGRMNVPFYRLAEPLGVRTFLSGAGGDEFVTSDASIAKLDIFRNESYRLAYSCLRGNMVTRPLRMVKLLLQSRGFIKTNPMLVMAKTREEKWNYHPLRDDIVEEFDLEAHFKKYCALGYQSYNRFLLENPTLSSIPARMETCNEIAAGKKIECRWPLVDVRLVSFYLAVPPEEKFSRDMGRLLHRRAIDGVTPPIIGWRKTKATGTLTIKVEPRKPVFTPGNAHTAIEEIVDPKRLERLLQENQYFQNHNSKPHSVYAWRCINQVNWLQLWLDRFLADIRHRQ